MTVERIPVEVQCDGDVCGNGQVGVPRRGGKVLLQRDGAARRKLPVQPCPFGDELRICGDVACGHGEGVACHGHGIVVRVGDNKAAECHACCRGAVIGQGNRATRDVIGDTADVDGLATRGSDVGAEVEGVDAAGAVNVVADACGFGSDADISGGAVYAAVAIVVAGEGSVKDLSHDGTQKSITAETVGHTDNDAVRDGGATGNLAGDAAPVISVPVQRYGTGAAGDGAVAGARNAAVVISVAKDVDVGSHVAVRDGALATSSYTTNTFFVAEDAGIAEGEVLHGAARADASEEALAIFGLLRDADAADGVAVAVEGAFEIIVCIARDSADGGEVVLRIAGIGVVPSCSGVVLDVAAELEEGVAEVIGRVAADGAVDERGQQVEAGGGGDDVGAGGGGAVVVGVGVPVGGVVGGDGGADGDVGGAEGEGGTAKRAGVGAEGDHEALGHGATVGDVDGLPLSAIDGAAALQGGGADGG